MAESEKRSSSVFERLVPVLLVVSILLAFAVGMLWQKVGQLGKGTGSAIDTTQEALPSTDQLTNGKLSEEQAKSIPEVSKSDFVRGGSNPEFYLIEYSDLECPFCKTFHPTAQQALDEYGDKMGWVFRHFPLDSIHPKARTEALAVECAGDQKESDGFWNLIDKIYEVTPGNNGLDLTTLPTLANQVGLDGNKLQDCIDAKTFADKIEKDYQGGIGAGVNGTPGSFIVNKKGEAWFVPGAVPLENLKTMINEAIGS